MFKIQFKNKINNGGTMEENEVLMGTNVYTFASHTFKSIFTQPMTKPYII